MTDANMMDVDTPGEETLTVDVAEIGKVLIVRCTTSSQISYASRVNYESIRSHVQKDEIVDLLRNRKALALELTLGCEGCPSEGKCAGLIWELRPGLQFGCLLHLVGTDTKCYQSEAYVRIC